MVDDEILNFLIPRVAEISMTYSSDITLLKKQLKMIVLRFLFSDLDIMEVILSKTHNAKCEIN
jgi:hypothetical protein